MKNEDLFKMEVSVDKPDVDFTIEVNAKLQSLESLDCKKDFSTILDELYQLEKKTRTGGDAISTAKILASMVKLCFNTENWNLLNEIIIVFTKKRSQLKLSIIEMIREAMSFIDKIVEKEPKLKLIDTIRIATEGKIFVENERARVSRMLAKLKEDEGDISTAAKILEEVQVDTFGTMEKREKVEFILEQMRLLIANEDIIKAQIVAKKINPKFFNEESYSDLKFNYYKLMIQMDRETSFIKTSKHYQAMIETQNGSYSNHEEAKKMFIYATLYCILSPYDNEQSDTMLRLSKNKLIDDLPRYKSLLSLFLSNELIDWNSLNSQYKAEFLSLSIFDTTTKHGIKCWKELRNRTIEYNIRTVSKYYTKIHLSRLSELLLLNESETEKHLSNLIVGGTIKAKMDRLSGVVNFLLYMDNIEKLNQWSIGLKNLMYSIEKTSHLIEKEECVQKALLN